MVWVTRRIYKNPDINQPGFYEIWARLLLGFAWSRCLENVPNHILPNDALMVMNPMVQFLKNHQKKTNPSELHYLKLTAIAPENRPCLSQKETRVSYSTHPFSGAKMWVSGKLSGPGSSSFNFSWVTCFHPRKLHRKGNFCSEKMGASPLPKVELNGSLRLHW